MASDDTLKGAGSEGTENVLTLLPGGKPGDSMVVMKLREILKDAEAGKFDDFLFIGMKTGLDEAQISWPMLICFRLRGALQKAAVVL